MKTVLSSVLLTALLAILPGFAANAQQGESSIGYYTPPLVPTSFVNFQGAQIALYESEGTRGPGILMVHGNTSSANSYARVFRSRFAKNFKVVLMDLPGYGASEDSVAGTYNVAYWADAIAAVAQHVGADDGVLVGWSLGGDLIIQASTRLPNVKGYFTFGTAPIGFDPTLPPPFLTPEQSYAGAAVNFGVIAPLTPLQISDYVNAFFRPSFGRLPRFIFEDGLRTDPDTRGAILAAATGQDPTFADEVVILQNLNVPVALISGDTDAFLNLDSLQTVGALFPTLFAGEAIIVHNTGHALHYERPFRFNQLLRWFLDEI